MNTTFENTKKYLYRVISLSDGLSNNEIYAYVFKKLKDHDLCREFLKQQGYLPAQIYNSKAAFCKNKEF